MRSRDLFQPFYVVAVILGATALGCLLRVPGDRRPLPVRPASFWPSAMRVYTV